MKIDPRCICKTMIEIAEEINNDFENNFESPCYCAHTIPPCNACLHHGNPLNDHDICEQCFIDFKLEN